MSQTNVTLAQKIPASKLRRSSHSVEPVHGGRFWLSQDPTSLERILDVKTDDRAAVKNGRLHKPAKFSVSTNYASYIDRLELLIWGADDSPQANPLVRKQFDTVAHETKLEWDGLIKGKTIKPGTKLYYAVKAYDKNGYFDQSIRKTLHLTSANKKKHNLIAPELSVSKIESSTTHHYSKLKYQSIPIHGNKVRLFGQDLKKYKSVRINDERIKVDKTGHIGLEFILPDGRHDFIIELTDNQDIQSQVRLSMDVDGHYFFMVALADLTVGENSVTGSLEPIAIDKHHYGGDIFVDGRLAFYLKGKVKGKYLLTAQMDTGTEDVSELFENFHQKDPSSVFSRLDPEQYYPIYGDDSTLHNDTDSQGKLYVRINWDHSRLLWGNYHTDFSDTDLASYNRSLYGAQLKIASLQDTKLGDAKKKINIFASKPQSVSRHIEFLGTGGSLYYLQDTDIVIGSEKVRVEIREESTNRVLDRISLVSGRDYEIDDFQGRLILRRPLLDVTFQGIPSIIRDEPQTGNQVFLVVDYEFNPPDLEFDNSSYGFRGKGWVSDQIGVGGTWVNEQRDEQDYDLKGADLTLKKSEQTYMRLEYAETASSQSGANLISNDGGLSFTPIVNTSLDASGEAFSFEGRFSPHDFTPDTLPVEIGTWASHRSTGFSTANYNVVNNTTQAGVEAIVKPTENTTFFTRISQSEEKSIETITTAAMQLDYLANEKLSLSSEIKNNKNNNGASNTTGKESLIAGKVSYDINSSMHIYAIHQLSIEHSGNVDRNNATTLGTVWEIDKLWQLNGEVSAGDKGDNILLGAEISLSDSYDVYSNYRYSAHATSIENNALTLGHRKSITNRTKVFSEHSFSDSDTQQSYAHTAGLNRKIGKHTKVGISLQQTSLHNESDQKINRQAASSSFDFKRNKTRLNSKLEYRVDKSETLDSKQWLSTNKFEYRQSPSFRWQGKLDASVTRDQDGNETARFIESGIGFALRPVQHDRLNLLGRITYLRDLHPRSQNGSPDQRAFIASTEGTVDLTRQWSIGAKLAQRISEARQRQISEVWVDNDATLAALRMRYHTVYGIDFSVAYHWLASAASTNERHGAVLSLGYRATDNLTLTVGYNFSEFDDDLGNEDHDVKGWFVNLIGSY